MVFWADVPSTWVFHSHQLHHTANEDVEPCGLMQLHQYEGTVVPSGPEAPTAMPPVQIPGMRH